MIKFAQLLTTIDNFSKDAHWDYQLAKFAKETADLLSEADEFDIKDEELFNQFESFIDTYRELIGTLGINSSSLSTESFEDAAQLIDTLKTRYDRIMTNPYLNAKGDEGYAEEFDPGTFTNFLSEVAQDAENKLKTAAGEDIDISEVRAAQYAREFNAIDEEYKGTKEDAWSAERVKNALEARKRWFQNLMFKKKLNINDPDYQKYIETRRRNYREMVESFQANPEKKEYYLEKARQRFTKFYNKLDVKKKEITHLLQKTRDPKKIAELTAELQLIEAAFAQRDERLKKEWQKKKSIQESGTLDGEISKLSSNMANVKMGIKKDITQALASQEGSTFKPYIDRINAAAQSGDANLVASAKKDLQKALNAAAEAHPELMAYKEHGAKYSNFINQLKTISKLQWMSPEVDIEQVRPHLEQMRDEGERLLAQRDLISGKDRFLSHKYTIKSIVNLLNNRLYESAGITTAMNRKNRLKILKKIEAEANKEESDCNNSDQNNLSSENYGHQVFEELLNNLYIEELDS